MHPRSEQQSYQCAGISHQFRHRVVRGEIVMPREAGYLARIDDDDGRGRHAPRGEQQSYQCAGISDQFPHRVNQGRDCHAPRSGVSRP